MIRYLKLHYICCKYRYIVDDQLKELLNSDENDLAIKMAEKGETTNYDTRDMTLPTALGPPQQDETVDVSAILVD